MSSHYSSLTREIRLSVGLDELPLNERREIFRALLLNHEVCPGARNNFSTVEERRNALDVIDKWAGWEG